MEITYKQGEFRIKGKTGVLFSKENGVLIESSDGSTKKELFGSGEYEVSGISVVGVKTDGGLPAQAGVVFVYEVDNLRICNLGKTDKKLPDAKVSQIGDIDILLLPKASESIELLQQIESYYIIPFAYEKEEDLEKFLKESSLIVERMNKFSLKKEDLIEDATAQIIMLVNRE